MKSESSPAVLAIDAGSRQIGVSVFNNEELVFYAVKSIKRTNEEKSLVKLRKIIETLIAKYKIKFAAIEKVVFVQQHRTFVKIVYDEIKQFLKGRNLAFFEYNPKLIRAVICRFQKPTKRNMALILSQRYTELTRYCNVPRRWQRIYFAQLFDAVAVGLVCARELEETRQLSPNFH